MIWPSDQNYLEGLIKFCAGWNIHLANLKFAQLKIHALLHLVISIWYTLEPSKQGYRQYFVFINFPSEHMCLFRGKDDCSVFFSGFNCIRSKVFCSIPANLVNHLWVFQHKAEALHFPFQTQISVTIHDNTTFTEFVSLFHIFGIEWLCQDTMDLLVAWHILGFDEIRELMFSVCLRNKKKWIHVPHRVAKFWFFSLNIIHTICVETMKSVYKLSC